MDCLFCRFALGEIPVDYVAQNDHAFAINDINPVAPTHVLIIPKAHHENAAEVAGASAETLAALFSLADEIATERKLTGYRTLFNTGASAGQSVFHAHLHLIAGRSLAWPPG